jgi:prophage regulatory protein
MDDEPSRLVRLPEVLRLTGLGRTAWLAEVREGRAPAPVRLSARTVAWRLVELREWIEARPRVNRRAA